MAATISSQENVTFGQQFLIRRIHCTSMTSDLLENIAHGGPAGAKVAFVHGLCTVSAIGNDPVSTEWIKASDSLVNDTVAVKFKVPAGGAILDAEVDLYVFFVEQASGGIVV